MITGWLLKMVLSFALVGFLLVEGGSPLITRAQLDDVAHDAADNAVLEILDHNDAEQARAVAEEIATDEDAALTRFTIDQQGVTVTVEREARSFLLKKFEPLESWYDVEVTATAARVRG